MRESSDVRLRDAFFGRSTLAVAKELLGKFLVRRLADGTQLTGIVVEVEAYLSSGDAASHSHRGLGKKNASMFRPAGTLYVYPIHSRYCLNVVTEPAGQGAAVLIRAVEPLEGLLQMAQHRKLPPASTDQASLTQWSFRKQLTVGPGRLCQALQVDRELDGEDLRSSQKIWLERGSKNPPQRWKRRSSQRIGISKDQQLSLRWFIDGNRFVSGCARDHSAGRTWQFRD